MSKNCEGKTTSGDYLLEGNVVIGGSLTVEESITTQQLNVVTEHVTNLDATNAVIDTSNTTTANIGTSNTNLAGINTSNTVTANINTANVNTATIASQTGNNATIYHVSTTDLNVTASSFLFNSMTFNYASGSWQPILCYIFDDAHIGGSTIDFVNVPGAPPTNINGTVVNFENGYYERMGNQVTVHFSCSYTTNNFGYGPGANYGFPAIRNLPFPFVALGGIYDYQEVEELGNCSWPNGIAGAVPALYTPTYPYPYTGKLYTSGATVSLDLWLDALLVPIDANKGTHTCDGVTIPIFSNIEFYEANLGAPPYSLSNEVFGLVSNFNMLEYSSYVCSFEGRFTYNA